jgi:hypothetical protein
MISKHVIIIRSSSLHGLEPIQHLCSLGVVVANDLFRVVYRNLVVGSRVLVEVGVVLSHALIDVGTGGLASVGDFHESPIE